MKTKKLLAVLLATLIMLTMFAACGDKSDHDSEKDDKTAETSTSGNINSDSEVTDPDMPDYLKDEHEEENNTTGIHPGRISGNTYTNTSVGITFTKPDDWKFKFTNAPSDKADFYESLSQGGVTEMEAESPNGSLSVGFQDLSAVNSENTTEEDFLTEIKEIWSHAETSEIYKKTISNHTYSAVDITVKSNEDIVNQRIYVRKEGKYIIAITMTSTSDNDFDSLEKLFS